MSRCFFLALILLFAAAPAAAQEATDASGDLNLPQWAAPPPATSSDTQADTDQAAPPTFPGDGGDPAPVPVDGGLSLLALAGAGYAAHRLRRREQDDEADA